MDKDYRRRYHHYRNLFRQRVAEMTGGDPNEARVLTWALSNFEMDDDYYFDLLNAVNAKKGDNAEAVRNRLATEVATHPRGHLLVKAFDKYLDDVDEGGQGFHRLQSIGQALQQLDLEELDSIYSQVEAVRINSGRRWRYFIEVAVGVID